MTSKRRTNNHTVHKKRPDTAAHPHPSAITNSIAWVGRTAWDDLPMLTHPTDCNIFLLRGDHFDVLIDAGGNASTTKLERNIRSAGSDPERVREIWCTHSHLDHFIGAGHWVVRHPRTRVRVSHVAIRFLKRKDYRLVAMRFSPAMPGVLRVPRTLEAFRQSDVLDCPPFKLRVHELPGHTPDCVALRGKVDGFDVMFSGDVAIGDQNGSKGVLGWLDGYWRSNVSAYERSLKTLAIDPPDLLLPGHGLPHFGASARRSLRNCLTRIQRFKPWADMFPLAIVETS